MSTSIVFRIKKVRHFKCLYFRKYRRVTSEQPRGLVWTRDTAACKRGHLAASLQTQGRKVYISMEAGDPSIYFITPGDADFLEI